LTSQCTTVRLGAWETFRDFCNGFYRPDDISVTKQQCQSSEVYYYDY